MSSVGVKLSAAAGYAHIDLIAVYYRSGGHHGTIAVEGCFYIYAARIAEFAVFAHFHFVQDSTLSSEVQISVVINCGCPDVSGYATYLADYFSCRRVKRIEACSVSI